MKHLLKHDENGRINLPKVKQAPPIKTYQQVIEDGLVSLVELKNEDTGLNFRDFSLQSLIDSENTQLLNSVGTINNTQLEAFDNMSSAIPHLEQLSEQIDTLSNVEPLNNNNNG